MLSVQPDLCGSNDLRVRRKMAKFNRFFSVQGTCGSPTGPDPENRVRDKTFEAQVGQFLLGCKCQVSRGIVVQEQDPPWWTSLGVFPSKTLQLHLERWVILRVYSLGIWKIINKEDAVLIPKNRGENFSSGFLHSEFFGAGWAAMPPLHWLLLCFVSGS